MKILVVDDDAIMLEAIAHILKADGYQVAVAEDSHKALSILANEDIHLILADIMMPDMSGLELLNLVNEFYFNRIPVIIISSLSKPDIISCSKALGAKEFIVKPIDFEKLSFCIKKYAA